MLNKKVQAKTHIPLLLQTSMSLLILWWLLMCDLYKKKGIYAQIQYDKIRRNPNNARTVLHNLAMCHVNFDFSLVRLFLINSKVFCTVHATAVRHELFEQCSSNISFSC
jgi:hypothetical protein